MKTIKEIFKGLVITFLIVSVYDVDAQNIYTANMEKSNLIVNGSSTLHEWHMGSNNFECVITATDEINRFIIQNVNFICNSTSLKGKNPQMNKKALEALKTNIFKTISFESKEQVEVNIIDRKVDGKLTGELFITGEKKLVSLTFIGEFNEFGNLKLKGEVKLKMSEFGITPPSLLLGSIKTGDEITIVYDLYFN